jgi:hypothetical protein
MTRPKSIIASSLALVLCVTALGEETATTEKALRFDYHTVRGRRAKTHVTGIYEGETRLTRQGKSRVQGMRNFGTGWSGDAHLLWDGVVGESMETTFRVEQGGRFRLSIRLTKAPDYGSFSVMLNAKEIHKGVDLYSPRVELAKPLDFGEITLAAGDQKLAFTLTGANRRSKKFRGKGYLMGLDYLKLVRLEPPVAKSSPKRERERGKDESIPSRERRPSIRFDDAKVVLAQYCYRCHSGAKPKGKIDLKKHATKADFLANIELTRKIAAALDQHEMPPEDEKQPRKPQRRQLVSMFSSLVDEYGSFGKKCPTC